MSLMDRGKKSEKSEPKRKNVQVAIRLRPLNDVEKGERARPAVTVQKVSNMINVKDKSTIKEFGAFDKVYGQDTAQVTIYRDLVAPLVRDVISGYNCTIFAYGQTGTGKTYTMEGKPDDTENDYTWESDPKAGIIPRALHHIFNELDNQNFEEYSVRVSYVELYNEELYDLLSASEVQDTRLRIFEDPARKGSVLINGMEEVPVRSRHEVYAILKKGAEKRRTAATLMNMNSSRSHSVFTVTVVIRENAVNGEELLKQGKLNLVDLAGSECIGRSGSCDIRAREAGNINQSLLTLGRVITALTSNAPHIPYRESKLTRLLQDSLGGRTITTIIATLSPSSTSTEESINTLEYAQRAKNIKNNPEINQKLSRRALLKEYNDEIERLRRDLLAAREKNGIYVAKENYEEMQTRITNQEDYIEELSAKLDATCNRIQTLLQDVEIMDEQYTQVYGRCVQIEGKLAMRRTEVENLKKDLAETKSNLNKTKLALELVEKAGVSLQAQSTELIETCTMMSVDLRKTHDKIDAMKEISEKNDKLLGEFAAGRVRDFRDLGEGFCELKSASAQTADQISGKCDDILRKINERTDGLARSLMEIKDRSESSWIKISAMSKESFSEFLKNSHIFCDAIDEKHATMKQFAADCLESQRELVGSVGRSIEALQNLTSELSSCFIRYTELQKSQMEAVSASRDRYREKLSMLQQNMRSKIESMQSDYDLMSSLCSDIENDDRKSSEDQQKAAEAREAGNTTHKNFSAEIDNLQNVKNTFEEVIVQHEASVVKAYDELAEMSANERMGSDMAYNQMIEVAEEAVSKIRKKVTSINERAQSQTARLRSEVGESIAEVARMIADSQSLEAEIKDRLDSKLNCTEKAVEHFVHTEFARLEPTGMTPKRSEAVFPSTAIEMPNTDVILMELDENSTPRRSSFYRTRESLLEVPYEILSPTSLKNRLNSLQEVTEECDKNTGCFPPESEFVTARRRRHKSPHEID